MKNHEADPEDIPNPLRRHLDFQRAGPAIVSGADGCKGSLTDFNLDRVRKRIKTGERSVR